MIKNLTRFVTIAALLAATSGCYSFGLNGKELTKPVSMSATVGRPVTLKSHFKHDLLVTWYLLGLIPLASFPGGRAPIATPADRLVAELLKEELKEGDAIINLRVSHGVTLPAVGISVVLGFIPIVGAAVGALFQPMGVTIEGDVVRFSGRGAVPQGPVISRENGELDMAGVDINAMLREQAEALAKADQ